MTHAGCRTQCGTVSTNAERGYSLIEALIAVAIIGIISLVAVPNFIQFMRAGKIRTAVRQFSGDVRGARQLAVSRNLQTKISFAVGAIPAGSPPGYRVTYRIQQRRGTNPWIDTNVDGRGIPMDPVRELEESIYFDSSNFTDVDADASTVDIIFQPNGTLAIPPVPIGADLIVLKTAHQVPKPSFQVQITPAGAVRTF